MPAFPHVVMICEDRVGSWTPMMDAVGGPGASPHFRNTLWTGGGAVPVAAGVCQEEKREQQFGIKDLGSCPHPPLVPRVGPREPVGDVSDAREAVGLPALVAPLLAGPRVTIPSLTLLVGKPAGKLRSAARCTALSTGTSGAPPAAGRRPASASWTEPRPLPVAWGHRQMGPKPTAEA